MIVPNILKDHSAFIFKRLLDPQDEVNTVPSNIRNASSNNPASYPRRLGSSDVRTSNINLSLYYITLHVLIYC